MAGNPIIPLDPMALPDGGSYPLKAGAVYSLAKTRTLTCNLTRSGVGPNPLIQYTGDPAHVSAAFAIPLGKAGGVDGVDFLINGGCNVANVQGGFTGKNMTVRGGGGWLQTQGCDGDVLLQKCVIADTLKYYAVFGGSLVTANDATHYVERRSRSITLLDCQILRGIDASPDHLLRFSNVVNVGVCGGAYRILPGQPSRCTIRAHNCDKVIVGYQDGRARTQFAGGDANFGPMGGGDGGINMPAGPRRDFNANLSLGFLGIYCSDFDTGDFALCAGIASGEIQHCTVKDVRGGAIIDTYWPYLNRCKPKLRISTSTFDHRDGLGRLFSGPNGSSEIVVDPDVRVNGKAVDAHGNVIH